MLSLLPQNLPELGALWGGLLVMGWILLPLLVLGLLAGLGQAVLWMYQRWVILQLGWRGNR